MPSGGAFEGDRSVLQDLGDEQVDQAVGLVDGQVDGADLALGFGADVPHLPGRPALFQHRHDPISGLADPAGIRNTRGLGCGASAAATIAVDGVTTAKHNCGFGQPGARCSA